MQPDRPKLPKHLEARQHSRVRPHVCAALTAEQSAPPPGQCPDARRVQQPVTVAVDRVVRRGGRAPPGGAEAHFGRERRRWRVGPSPPCTVLCAVLCAQWVSTCNSSLPCAVCCARRALCRELCCAVLCCELCCCAPCCAVSCAVLCYERGHGPRLG